MDMTVKTKDYVFEFKFNKSAEEALQQINEKGYAEPFAKDGRNIIRIGVNFSTKCRNIDKWIVSQ